MHFGKGLTEASIKLAPGDYKLTMQFADGLHCSYGKKWAATISIKALLKNGIIGAEQMDVIHSGEIVIWSVVGGLGTLVGSFVGASFVHYLNDFPGEHTERAILIIGLFFIITILPAPKGIVGSLIQVWLVQAPDGNEE